MHKLLRTIHHVSCVFMNAYMLSPAGTKEEIEGGMAKGRLWLGDGWAVSRSQAQQVEFLSERLQVISRVGIVLTQVQL